MSRRGSALLEFALAWPAALTAVLLGIQVMLWGTGSSAARTAALAGARAGASADGDAALAEQVALAVLRAGLLGATAGPACGDPVLACAGSDLQVTANVDASTVQVTVSGSIPALVPAPAARLPISSTAVLPREAFSP